MRKTAIGLIAMCVMGSAYARDDTFEFDWGLYGKAGSYSVEDPNGSAADEFAFMPGAKITFPFSRRGKQFVGGVELIEFSLDASESNLGQDVSGYRVWGGYEHRFNISRSFKFWGGIGLTLDSVSFEKRHTIDEDGFLKERFDDRDEAYSGLTVYALSTIDVGRRSGWEPALGVYIDQPFGDGVSSIGGTFQINFK